MIEVLDKTVALLQNTEVLGYIRLRLKFGDSLDVLGAAPRHEVLELRAA